MMYREQLEDLRRWYLFLYCRLKLRDGSSRLGWAERASARVVEYVGDVLHLSNPMEVTALAPRIDVCLNARHEG